MRAFGHARGFAAKRLLVERTTSFLLLTLGFIASALGASSSGLTCRIVADVLDSGGARLTAGACSVDSSLGGFLGTGDIPAEAVLGHSGYASQLYDPRVLLASATPDVVPEEATTQLSAIQRCDDGTYRRPDSPVFWPIVGGPVNAIDPAALAYTAIMYQPESAYVSASADGLSGSAEFLVTDVDPDNFGSYAGDDVSDGWQVGYFGIGNPDGAAESDFDEDLQDNRFEFYAGTDPTLETSQFRMAMVGQPGPGLDPDETTNGYSVTEADITFSPAFTSRTYAAVRSTNLMTGAWNPMTNAWVLIGSERGAIRNVAESNRFQRLRFPSVTTGDKA